MKKNVALALKKVLCALIALAALISCADGASRVFRLTLPRFVEEEHDLQLILYHRDGEFHHGYARIPTRDNLPHEIDITPSPPVQFGTADGQPIEVPESLRRKYSYTNEREAFSRYRDRYDKREIRIEHPWEVQPISWQGDSLKGHVDVLIQGVGVANRPGRDKHDAAFRVKVDATRTRGQFEGAYSAWKYEHRDAEYGKNQPRTQGQLHGVVDDEFWVPQPAMEYARGKDWPNVRGPHYNGSAIESSSPLVDNLDNARFVWIAEERLGGGRSAGVSRGNFQMYPAAWTNSHFGGFAGPVVVDGRVFLHVMEPDYAALSKDSRVPNNIYVRLGADPGVLANELGHLRDAVICFDAHTGKTLWHFRSQETFRNVKTGKSGRGTTVCVRHGKIVARGWGGLYCLDAVSGERLWKRSGATGIKPDRFEYSASSGGVGGDNWSRDVSPVAVDRTIIMTDRGALAGFSFDDGRMLWRVADALGSRAIPTPIQLDGKTFLIAAGQDYEPSEKERQRGHVRTASALRLIDPASGQVLWRNHALASNKGTLVVVGDVVIGNGIADPKVRDNKKDDGARAEAVRVTIAGAEPLWRNEDSHFAYSRVARIGHGDFAYLDSRGTGWQCLQATSGELVNRHPHIYEMSGGSHNWTWAISSNDRVFTSGILMFKTGKDGFERMLGRLSLDLADGYTCSIKPAIADGRLFVRTGYGLACYDLRKK